jgi:pimeloyl-ACP methyl ester carboxylesterase
MSKSKNIYIKNSVTSKDGTIIGYRQMGNGPGIILLHGGVNASQNLMKLGTALSDEFTVYIPDRRGRGMSGPIDSDYSIEKEDEDLDAILNYTSANFVFGTADGALFALHAAISLPAIKKVVAYEPLLFVGQPGLMEFKALIKHFDDIMAEGKVAEATTALTKDSIKFLKIIPNFIMTPIVKLIFWYNARNVKGDDVAYQDLMYTMHYELMLVQQTEGTLENYKNVSSEILLLGGSKSPPLLKESLLALNNILPKSNLTELK